MAEPRDEELRARYRALATEEPSAAIDSAIRAAARRAVGSAPGGVQRSRTARWAVPASLAAVLVLSFGVVMRMEQEVPPLEIETRSAPLPASPAPAAPPEARVQAEPPRAAVAPQPAKEAPKDLLKEKKRIAPAFVPEPASAPQSVAKETLSRESPAPAAQAPAAPAAAAPAAPQPRAFSDAAPLRAPVEEQRNVAPDSRRDEAVGASGLAATAPRAKTESFAAKRAAEAPAADRLAPWPDTPEKKLERIEELRKAGRDREADEAIARFRREHPDYRIPDAVWERLKPRE